MSDYTKFVDLANRLIDKNGMKMKYLAITEQGPQFDPDAGQYPISVDIKEVMGVKTAPAKEDLERGYFQGLKMVVLIAGDKLFNPDKTDMMQFDGHDWDVKEPVAIAPAEQNILWKIGVEDLGLSGENTRDRAIKKAYRK